MKIDKEKITLIGPKINLSESPIWVKKMNSFLWADVYKKKIYFYNVTSKIISNIKLNKKVCFIKHYYNNYFVLGLQNELCIFNSITFRKKSLIIFNNLKKSQRINDGNIDKKNNIFFSVYDESKKILGKLYKFNLKEKKLDVLDKDYLTPNGPAFFKDKYMFHNDTSKNIIYLYKINNKFKKEVFLKFDKRIKPDGIFIKNKYLYVGVFGQNYIMRINIETKTIMKILFPAKNITSCTIGGKKNNILFVTSSLKRLNNKDIKTYPYSGYAFFTNINAK